MKVEQLRKLIREEVRSAFKEELTEVLTEAVKIASAPVTNENQYRPVEKKDIQNTWSTGNVSLNEMLEQTAAGMTGTEANNIMGSGAPQKPNFAQSMGAQMGMTENAGPMPGIDISKLDFVGKAKAVLDASDKKDKQKAGL